MCFNCCNQCNHSFIGYVVATQVQALQAAGQAGPRSRKRHSNRITKFLAPKIQNSIVRSKDIPNKGLLLAKESKTLGFPGLSREFPGLL